MGTFFDTNKSAKLYIRKAGRNKCYSKKGFFKKYIGIQKGLLSKYKNRIEIVSGDYKLTEGVYLIPHKVAGEDEAFGVGDKIGKREKMYIKKGFGKWAFDNFAHEQSLVFETEEGLVVFNSCSHGGADNIINEIREAFPGKKIRAMIGGFHLYNKTDEEVQSFTQRIKKMDVDYICTGHCTGQKAYEILEAELGEIVHQLRVGLIMKF